jgi:glycosyltransferase involved in cell wall biosynthesis
VRIAFLAVNLGRELKGGELYVDQLARALQSRGHDVTVYVSCAGWRGAYRTMRVPVPYAQSWRHALPLALSVTSLARQVGRRANRAAHTLFAAAAALDLVRRRPHVVIPMFGEIEMGWAKVVRRAVGTHIVTVGHGTAADDAAALLARPDAFVATSPRQAGWAAYFASTRVALIPVGVDHQLFTPEGPQADVSLERPFFLVVGSLSSVKRVSLAVEAVARFGRGGLLVVGDGPLAAETDRLGAELLGDRYRRLTRVTHGDLPAYYRAADALLFPSDSSETAGLVPVEALASGCPVVAVDDEVRRWLLRDAADYADPADPQAFVAAMERALLRQDRKVLRSAVARLDWSLIATEHERLYASLNGRGLATPPSKA